MRDVDQDTLSRGWFRPGKMEPLSEFSRSRSLGDLMVDFPERESNPPIGACRFDLFMTVIRVANWQSTVRWYIDTLGLSAVVLDSHHEFALLSAGSGRLGVQGAKEARLAAGPGKGPARLPGA